MEPTSERSEPDETIRDKGHHLPNWLWCERCQAWIETQHQCGAQYIDRGTHYELVRPEVPPPPAPEQRVEPPESAAAAPVPAENEDWPANRVWIPEGAIALMAVSPELENVEGDWWIRAASAPQEGAEMVEELQRRYDDHRKTHVADWDEGKHTKTFAAFAEAMFNCWPKIAATLRSHRDETAIRRAAFNEAIAIAKTEHLKEPTTLDDDVAYDTAIEHVIEALESARDTTPTDDSSTLER